MLIASLLVREPDVGKSWPGGVRIAGMSGIAKTILRHFDINRSRRRHVSIVSGALRTEFLFNLLRCVAWMQSAAA